MGCASYKAPVGDDVATLRAEARNVKIFNVDGAATWSWYHQSDGVSEVKLTPGKHVIRAQAFLGGYYADCHLWFVAEAGGCYEVRYQLPDQLHITFWIVDTATGRPVGGVKGSDDEPPDPPDHP
jgi:hypothetical protein